MPEDLRDHPCRRRLAVRPDYVDAGKAPLRHAERRHELAHPVEAQPHAEQLEVEQMVFGLSEVHPAECCGLPRAGDPYRGAP
jgi:hypothetical protein